MSNTSLVLGNNWDLDEWPEYINVIHEADVVHGDFSRSKKYVPERSCKNLATRKDGFACSECKCEVAGCMIDDFGSFDNTLCFSYCPNCGSKVVR